MKVKGKEEAPDRGSFLAGLRTRKLLVLALLGRTGNAEVFRRGTACVCVCVDVVRVPATFYPKLMGGEGLHLLRQPTTRGQSWTLL